MNEMNNRAQGNKNLNNDINDYINDDVTGNNDETQEALDHEDDEYESTDVLASPLPYKY